MKKAVVITAVLGMAVASQAGLINWSTGNFGANAALAGAGNGANVALYIDVNGDSGLTGLVVNPDFSVAAGSGAGMVDDLYALISTSLQNPVAPVKTISPVTDFNVVPDNALVYTVIFNDAFTQGAIIDASPFNSGNAAPPATSTDYVAGADGSVAGAMGGVSVIPEPATIGLMGVAGLGMFLARRKARK